MKQKILITGVAGFIGSNLAQHLLLRGGYEVYGIDNLSYGIFENIPKGVIFSKLDIRSNKIYECLNGIDFVFHLAAKNCINDCQTDPVDTADINVKGTVNVFEAARRSKVKKVIYAESSAIYEGSKIFPTPESEEKPESFYGLSKLSSKYFAKAYQKYFGLVTTALRYFCVYGPAQDYRRTIPPVMSAFIIKLLQNERPIIYGTGEKRRDFVYVEDVNDFHLMCINDPNTNNKIFNIGSGINYSVLEIYEIIEELLNKKNEPIFSPDLPGEAQITLADISKATKIGWTPKTDIRTGLLKEIEYIKKEIKKGKI